MSIYVHLGGGSMGSYEAGVFIGLVKNQTPKDRTYDVVSGNIYIYIYIGVSAGSINAFIIALFASGDEEAAADYLYESWAKLTPDIIFDSWKYGIIQVHRNYIYIYIYNIYRA